MIMAIIQILLQSFFSNHIVTFINIHLLCLTKIQLTSQSYKKAENFSYINHRHDLQLFQINQVYLAYQLSFKDDAVYFPILYFQFMFICYIIYYFGRKSIMLATFNLAYIQREINSTIQLKLSKLMFAGLIFFFTVVFILNYIDYFIQQNNYHLCQAQFFNVITTVSFLLQGLFLLQIRQFTRQINKNMKNLENVNDEADKIEKMIKKRLSQIWQLINNIQQGFQQQQIQQDPFVSFVQNVYFVLMNEILRNQPERYTCYYVKLEDDPTLTNIINTALELSEKMLSFFLPYYAALIIFWPKKSLNQPSNGRQDSTDIIVETYVIQATEFPDQSSSRE
ncbi:unnamed protein product (macronuclear) [Paramecium tetraurelia]|uniref:Transmembrane protein n=1 Tax=Paramecium tetraurelia TaxID=5888 RepID=A0CWE2_PARTE|nr:uncharacterized protein GSPATT00001311001 [Paramecium tetraurelia]CAK75109.1 unnamed protein product [Paramecium tetraurelia]|eukprot:XP_001442506.1 hypothetical protein (macronuclear) [Paramecium tetraurelia strain d4-2]